MKVALVFLLLTFSSMAQISSITRTVDDPFDYQNVYYMGTVT